MKETLGSDNTYSDRCARPAVSRAWYCVVVVVGWLACLAAALFRTSCRLPGVLNGGILAALVDCHCVGTAVADAYRAERRTPDSEPPVWLATGSLSYLQPVPVSSSVELNASITERTSRKTRVECVVVSRGQVCARAEVVAVRLSDRPGGVR